jgi:hypothetical protein
MIRGNLGPGYLYEHVQVQRRRLAAGCGLKRHGMDGGVGRDAPQCEVKSSRVVPQFTRNAMSCLARDGALQQELWRPSATRWGWTGRARRMANGDDLSTIWQAQSACLPPCQQPGRHCHQHRVLSAETFSNTIRVLSSLQTPPSLALRHESAAPSMMQRTKVRRRVLACARCRKRKLSVLFNLANFPYPY